MADQPPFKQRSLRQVQKEGPLRSDPPPPVSIPEKVPESKLPPKAEATPPKKEKPKQPPKQQQPQQQGTFCSACRARRKRNEQRAKDNATRAAASEGESRGRHALAGRLPDGAMFFMTYDALKVCWSGTLTIRGFPEFRSVATSLFGLCAHLDLQYRAEVQKRASAASSAVEAASGSPAPPAASWTHPERFLTHAPEEDKRA
jgi:hypothetical protein